MSCYIAHRIFNFFSFFDLSYSLFSVVSCLSILYPFSLSRPLFCFPFSCKTNCKRAILSWFYCHSRYFHHFHFILIWCKPCSVFFFFVYFIRSGSIIWMHFVFNLPCVYSFNSATLSIFFSQFFSVFLFFLSFITFGISRLVWFSVCIPVCVCVSVCQLSAVWLQIKSIQFDFSNHRTIRFILFREKLFWLRKVCVRQKREGPRVVAE